MWEAEQSSGEISFHPLNFALNLKKLQKSEVKKRTGKKLKDSRKAITLSYSKIFLSS